MSTPLATEQTSPVNPYKAPVSEASPFAHTHKTLVTVCSVMAITLIAATWIYLRSDSETEPAQVKQQADAYSNYAQGRSQNPQDSPESYQSDDPIGNYAEPETAP